MSDLVNTSTPPAAGTEPSDRPEFEALVERGRGESVGQIIKKPVIVVAALLGMGIVALVWFLQAGSAAIQLDAPAVSYELLQNHGATAGVPIAISLGPLTVFKISDPMAGGSGASRAKAVVANIESAVQELIESPGRTITIDSMAEGQSLAIVQKASPNDTTGLEVIRVTGDDVTLAGEEDPKRVARVWAERLTDGLKLLQFGEPPKFTTDSDFGKALSTLHISARNDNGGISTDSIDDAFEALTDEQRLALTTFPIPEKAD